MPGPGGGFHVDVRWLGSMDQPSDGGKPLPFKNQKADQAVKYYAKRLFDIHGDKLPGSDAGKFIKEAVAYRRPLDGDDAEEGAAVALDDVVSEPSSLTLRPRIPEKDAVLMVAYARVDEGEVSLQVLHEMPVTACDALSCLDIAKQFAPDDTPREDLDFFVAAGYSDQDVKLVKTTLADDYLADRFVRVEASASVSEVVEPRRGRRHAHVLLFEQPCVHVRVKLLQDGVKFDVQTYIYAPEELVGAECATYFVRMMDQVLKDANTLDDPTRIGVLRHLPEKLFKLESIGDLKAYSELETRRGVRGPRTLQPLSSPFILNGSSDLQGAALLLTLEFQGPSPFYKSLFGSALDPEALDGRDDRIGSLAVLISDDVGGMPSTCTASLSRACLEESFGGIAQAVLKQKTNQSVKLSGPARLWTAPNEAAMHHFVRIGDFQTLDDDDPSLTTVQLSDRVRDAVPTSGPAGHHCLEVKLPGRMLPHTLIEVTVRDLSGTSVVDANPTMATRTADALDKSALELLEIWLNLSEESERNGPAEPSLAVELLRRLMNPGLSGALLPQLAITVATDGGAPAVVGDAAAPIKVADDSQVSRRFHFVLTCDVNAVRHDGAGARRCLLMVCVGPRGSVATKFFDVDDALLATSQVDLALRTLEEAAGGATTLRPEDVLKNSVFRVSDKFADERDAAARRTLASQLTELKGPCIAGSKLTFSSGSLRDAMRGFPERSSFLICNAACFAHARPGSTCVTVSVVNGDDEPALRRTECITIASSPKLPFPALLAKAATKALAEGTYANTKNPRDGGNARYKELMSWSLLHTTEIYASCNGEPARLVKYSDTVQEAAWRLGAPVCDVRLTVVMRSLGRRDAPASEAEAYWLRPELPPLVDACWAAVATGTVTAESERALKRLQVVARSFGNDYLKKQLAWLDMSKALGTFPQPASVTALEYFGTSIEALTLTDASSLESSRFRDTLAESYPRARDELAAFDALKILQLKRICQWVRSYADHANAVGAKPLQQESADFINRLMRAARERRSPQMGSHAHLAVAYLLFTYWLLEGGGKLIQMFGLTMKLQESVVQDDEELANCLSHTILCEHDFRDYDEGSGADARRALEDLAFLWVAKAPKAVPHLDAAAAAGNAFAAAVLARLRAGHPSKKLARKYDLTTFGVKFLELLPPGLQGLEQAISKYPVPELRESGRSRAPGRAEASASRSQKDIDAERAEASASFDVPAQGAGGGHAAKKKKPKKTKKKKAKAKEAMSSAREDIEETSRRDAAPVAARGADGVASSDSDSDSDASLTTSPALESPVAPSEPFGAAADGDDSGDWVGVARRARARAAPSASRPRRRPRRRRARRRRRRHRPPPRRTKRPSAVAEASRARRARGNIARAAEAEEARRAADADEAAERAYAEESRRAAAAAESRRAPRRGGGEPSAEAEEARRKEAERRRLEGESEALARRLAAEEQRASRPSAPPGAARRPGRSSLSAASTSAASRSASQTRGLLFGTLSRNGWILADLKKRKTGNLLQEKLWRPSVDAALVAALDGRRLSNHCYRALRDLDPERQALCALALESADLSTIKGVSGYIEKGLEKGTLLRKGHELVAARPREAPPAAQRQAASAFDAPVSKAEVQRRAKAFADAEGLDDGCRAALERYAARHADGCVRFLRAPGEIGSALKKLSLDQQRRARAPRGPGGVLFGVLNRNGRILIDLKKREMADLLRDNLGRPSVDLGARRDPLDGRRLSKDCYRALRDLDPERQALCAAALESADLSTIKDVSGYIETGLEKGTRSPRGPASSLVARDRARRRRRRRARRRAAARRLGAVGLGPGRFAPRAGAVPAVPSGVIGVTPGAARDDHVRVLDALEVALTTVDDHHDEALDAAIDGCARRARRPSRAPRRPLDERRAPRRRRGLRALLESLLACQGTRAADAAYAFRALGVLSDAPCARLRAKATTTPRDRGPRARGDGVHDRRRARARREPGIRLPRRAHAACSKSCDHCKAPGSVDVVIDIGQVPGALALSVATPRYTALVRDKRADAWTWYDRRDVTLVGSFESVVAKCRNDGGAPLCPYLLFYDAPAEQTEVLELKSETMPGSGGAFDVEVQWLGDDEDPLDDELLERLTSSVHSGRTVQSFADALFEKHGAKLNLSGDAQSLSDTIVAYRESLDIDDDEEAAPVELDDVVAESSLLTFRPRVPDADAVLFVAYALAEKGAVKVHLLREMSVAEIAPGTCGELATTLAPGRAHDPRDLDFFAASEYSARAEDRGSIHTSLGSDYKAGLDRYVRVDGSASVSEVVEARRGRRACHVLLFESARMRLRVVAIQPGAEDVALELPPRQPDEVVGAKCVTYVAESVRLALLDNAADAAIPATSLTDLQGVLLDLESDGYLTAYSELETREGGRGPRSPLRLSAPVVPDPRDDLCGAQCFIHVEIERGEKSWLVVLMEKLKAWQERPSRGTLKIQFSDDLGPLHDPKTITLRSGMMGMPFKGIAKFSLARAIEDANVVRDLQLPQHARLWTAVERGPSLHDFLSSDGFKSLHKDDPSLQDVLMSDSMLDVPPSRGDRGPESEYCLEVILSGLVLPATEVHVVLRVQTGQLFEPPNCMVTREKQHLDGSVFDLLENWLEVNGPAEKSRDATVHVVSCLLNPRSTATFLPHMKFSVKVDNDDAIDLDDDVYQDLKLTEAGRPAGVIVELIYDSNQGAGAEKCLLMLCVGPKGSIARKFFDIDDALLETTQAELACRTLGAARGNLRVEDVVQHSIFRMSAHYADARAPIDRKNVASGLENHNGSSELLKGAKLTLASDTLREAMEVHDFSDYDADSEARVRQALEDLSVLWMGKNPSSEKHLEAAAAAGNAFAAAVVERLRAGPPSRKLARKYDLTAFGAPFLELLPRGLRDLEQVISKYPVAQRKIRGPDRALEASRNEDAPREEEAPRSKAEVDKEIEEAMDKLEDVFVDAVAPAPASKKNAKKKAKKKAKAKEAKAEETSVAARDAHGSASIAHSDSDESFKSALCETPKARSPAAPPSEPLVAPADGADSDDWVDVSAARRGKGAAKRVESSPPPPTPPPPLKVPSPPAARRRRRPAPMGSCRP
ncbi:hypothetical protein SO694_00047159 [Aureococcus anophagefferens]|uniref:Calmodulin n=1 Tax=Aureococcus anophagefferens TaxID=44056 RepID=A0ABR1G7K6_AURAN